MEARKFSSRGGLTPPPPTPPHPRSAHEDRDGNKAYAIMGFEQRPCALGNLPFVVEWFFLSNFPANIIFFFKIELFCFPVTPRIYWRHLHAIDNLSLIYDEKDGLKLFWKNLNRCLFVSLCCNSTSNIQLKEYQLVFMENSYLINSLEMWMTFFKWCK